MPSLFQRFLSHFRAVPKPSLSPRSPLLRLEDLEERCLLNAATASAAVAPLVAAPSNQHHIAVVQNLLNQAQSNLSTDIQQRTQGLANQLTQDQTRVQKLQGLVSWTQTDITADQQAQAQSLSNHVTREQHRVDHLTTDLSNAQAALATYQQQGATTLVAEVQAVIQNLQNALTAAQAQLATDQQLQAQPPVLADAAHDQSLLQSRQTAVTNAQNAVTTIQQEQQNITSTDITNDQAHIQHYQSALAQLQGS